MIGEPCTSGTPLRITAILETAIRMPGQPVALDALLAAVVARRAGLLPPQADDEILPIEIPVERAACGRYHLATYGMCRVEERRLRHVHRRFPIDKAQALGRDIGRVLITAGPAKSYRIPVEALHLVDDRMTWLCRGDRERIEDLLAEVTHLGKKRNVGAGRVREWSVEDVDDAPMILDGAPLRALPEDTPGVDPIQARLAETRLTYPYWQWSDRELCWLPI